MVLSKLFDERPVFMGQIHDIQVDVIAWKQDHDVANEALSSTARLFFADKKQVRLSFGLRRTIEERI